MIDHPHGILQTPLGTVSFTMTEATHVFLRTDSKDTTIAAITIRNTLFHVSYHCHLIDGQWTTKDYQEPYLSRLDARLKEPSQAARKTAREVLAQAWSDYLRNHPKLSRKAEQAKVANEVKQLESELARLREKTDAKAAELDAARQRQTALEEDTHAHSA